MSPLTEAFLRVSLSCMKNLLTLAYVATLFVVLLTFSGCSAAGDEEATGTLTNAFTGNTGFNPNPLTFWWYAGDPTVLRPMLECALGRVRGATCLPVDVSMDAWHWVRQKSAAAMPGYAGKTNGTWDETRISILDTITNPGYGCNVLTHEIAQHVLRRSDTHAAGYAESNKYKITEQVVTDICARLDCGCFNPEEE